MRLSFTWQPLRLFDHSTRTNNNSSLPLLAPTLVGSPDAWPQLRPGPPRSLEIIDKLLFIICRPTRRLIRRRRPLVALAGRPLPPTRSGDVRRPLRLVAQIFILAPSPKFLVVPVRWPRMGWLHVGVAARRRAHLYELLPCKQVHDGRHLFLLIELFLCKP